MTSELNGGLPSFKIPNFDAFFIIILVTNVDVSSSELIWVDRICLDVFKRQLCFNGVTRWADLLDVSYFFLVLNQSRNEIRHEFVVAFVKLRCKVFEESALV